MFSFPADQSDFRPDQHGAARLDRFLSHRAVKSTLWVHESLGREEGQASSNAHTQGRGLPGSGGGYTKNSNYFLSIRLTAAG